MLAQIRGRYLYYLSRAVRLMLIAVFYLLQTPRISDEVWVRLRIREMRILENLCDQYQCLPFIITY